MISYAFLQSLNYVTYTVVLYCRVVSKLHCTLYSLKIKLLHGSPLQIVTNAHEALSKKNILHVFTERSKKV